ncbi:MAG: MFS transporter [Victivallales bacterium]|nr:MFS transporter [Victivallales bacterium]
MFGSYFFDDMFSTVSNIFNDPSALQLGWGQDEYGKYTSGYSILCIFGGLVLCGMLLDRWGVRITGSIFVGLMVAGAGMVTWALVSGLPAAQSLNVAWAGCMVFGLGSEIAGVAVTRSIAKWFKGRNMAFAMGLQLAIARLGTATAFLLSPVLIQQKVAAAGATPVVYTLAETARPAFFGMMLLRVGAIFWAVFVAMDARFDRESRQLVAGEGPVKNGEKRQTPQGSEVGGPSKSAENDGAESEQFRFKDVLKVLGNPNWWLLALLCVFFYSSIVAFKKFTGAILVPRFGVSAGVAGLMATILPFSTVVFAPLFGLMVDRRGHGTRWMVFGAVLALAAHLVLAFAPSGNAFWGYAAMILLGFSYSLVPAALWPSVPKVIPDRMLGTAFALIYWVQNLGLWGFKRFAGRILESTHGSANSADAASNLGNSPLLNVELMFLAVCVAALVQAILFAASSRRHPELALDKANR